MCKVWGGCEGLGSLLCYHIGKHVVPQRGGREKTYESLQIPIKAI